MKIQIIIPPENEERVLRLLQENGGVRVSVHRKLDKGTLLHTAEIKAALAKFAHECIPARAVWEGTSTKLLPLLVSLPESPVQHARVSATTLGRVISKMRDEGFSIASRILNGRTLWRIPSAFSLPGSLPQPTVEQ